MESTIKNDMKKLVDRLPEIIAAKRRLAAHIKQYGSVENFNDENIRFVKPL